MPTHPLWRPFELTSDEDVAAARIAPPPPRAIEVVPYDDAWPAAYDELRDRMFEVLGDRALAIEHVGSTAVPGLPAKPVIDIDLTVADSGDEATYVPALESAGFVLRIREPDWEEHRVLTTEKPKTNLHVFSPGAREPRRHVMFRDWLRTHAEDRTAYGEHKVAIAARGFSDGMDYNNHKAELVYDIYERVFAADPGHPHDLQPRTNARRA